MSFGIWCDRIDEGDTSFVSTPRNQVNQKNVIEFNIYAYVLFYRAFLFTRYTFGTHD